MYLNKDIETTISCLNDLRQDGLSLAEAIEILHNKHNVSFDDLWPAVMKVCQLSEREAMQLTKEWCRDR